MTKKSVLETAEVETDVAPSRAASEKRFTREEILDVYRDPLTDSSFFGLKDNEEFTYYWPIHNNPQKPFRLESLQAHGWEPMTVDMLPTKLRSNKALGASVGSLITRPAGAGKLEHVAMRMPTTLYRERALKKELYLQMTTDTRLGKRSKQMSGPDGIETRIDGGTIS